MYALTVRLKLPEGTDWSKIPGLAEDRARNLYREIPGLISKAFVYDPESREYGGNYVWASREALDAFLASDVWAAVKRQFGEPAYFRIHRVATYLDRGEVHVPAEAASIV